MPKQSKISDVSKAVTKYVPKTADINKVSAEITHILDLEKVDLNVQLYIDENASNETSTVVRNLFMTNAANVRLQINYFDVIEDVNVNAKADMAVIIGCDSSTVLSLASKVRERDVPCYIVFDSARTTSVSDFFANTEIAGDYFILNSEMPESVSAMTKKLGTWIANVCVGKKFAFAAAFPFVARPLAMEIVHLTSIENVAIGVVPFISKADFPLMLLNQIFMLGQIAAVYGHKIDANLLKEACGVLAGALVGRKVYRVLHKALPIPRCIVAGTVAVGTTETIGRALVAYFEAGGDIDGVLEIIKRTVMGSRIVSDAAKPVVDKVVSTVNAVNTVNTVKTAPINA